MTLPLLTSISLVASSLLYILQSIVLCILPLPSRSPIDYIHSRLFSSCERELVLLRTEQGSSVEAKFKSLLKNT